MSLTVSANPAADYLSGILPALPRLFTLLGRDPGLPGRGSFDRARWAWRLRDFPDGALVRGVEVLALLARLRARPGAPPELAALPDPAAELPAALAAAAAAQARDGSFDQVYPGERSWGATAFAAAGVAAVLGLAEARPELLDASARATGRAVLGRASRFLARSAETHGRIANHVAAGAYALAAAGRLLEGAAATEARAAARRLVARLAAWQPAEGWLPEYDGADFGYGTQALSFLARLAALAADGDAELAEAARAVAGRLAGFLAHFVHPDGTLGGGYGSRGTRFVRPAGFELLAADGDLTAAAAARRLREAARAGRGVTLAALDDANLVPGLAEWLQAAAAARELPGRSPPLPCETEGEWRFPGAGLLVRSTARYYAVFAPARGGVLWLHFKDGRARPVVREAGYAGRDAAGRTLATVPAPWPGTGELLAAEAPLVARPADPLTPWTGLLLRGFGLTLARSAALNELFKRRAVCRLSGAAGAPTGLVLRRRVEFLPDRVRLRDEFVGADGRTAGRDAARAAGLTALFPVGEAAPLQAAGARLFEALPEAERLSAADLVAGAPGNGASLAREVEYT